MTEQQIGEAMLKMALEEGHKGISAVQSKMGVKMTPKIKKRRRMLVLKSFVGQTEPLKRTQIEAITGLDEGIVRWTLKDLRDDGIIENIGPKYDTRYRIKT